MVLVAAVLIRGGIAAGVFLAPEVVKTTEVVASVNAGLPAAIGALVNVLFSLNLILFLFNLLPLPPMDGSSVLSFFMDDERARRYQAFVRNPQFTFLGMFIAWKVFDLVYGPLHLRAVNLLYLGEAAYR